jgi:DNA polymerase I-like protein with 3'-5' exonuclease and polymerase domains
MSPKAISLDSETGGLFISKGCRAFTLSSCSAFTGKNYLWKFKVNPFDRSVTYPKDQIDDIIDTLYIHDTIVFHNANYDLQVIAAIDPRLHWSNLFRDFTIHDTMLMSHAFKSSDRHGLKENAVLYLKYPDDDEKALEDATIKSRKIAKKLGWRIADKNDLHESIVGTQKSHHRCDYWVPEAVAEHLDYPEDHPWRRLCDIYAGKDGERTIGLFIVLPEVMKSIPNSSAYQTPLTDTPYLPPVEYTGTLYDKYEEARQLLEPLLDMQDVGIPIKPRALQAAIKTFTERRDTTLATLRRMTGMPDFNPGSPIQLRKALFQDYGFLPVPGKTGKDGPSTDKDVLTALLSDAPLHDKKIPERYEFVVNIKDYRKENATLTYLNNYDKHSAISDLKRDKRRVIISSFSQTGTGSGRLSSQNPNTTNVGKKDMFNQFEDEKNRLRATLFAEILGIDTDARFSLRNVFGPLSGEQWTCIDYDQFQLRIFAIVSESYELVESFERGDDVHMTVARRIFGKDDITDVERTAAKAINFGLLFGAGPAKIERLAGVPGLYSLFMSAFPKAKVYLDAQSRLARSKGYVHTVGGYRLYVPFKAPHAASCYVIQGTEAEIVKRAMVGVHAYRKSLSQSREMGQTRALSIPNSNRTFIPITSDAQRDNPNQYRPSPQAGIRGLRNSQIQPNRSIGPSTSQAQSIPTNTQSRRPTQESELRRPSRPNSRTEDRTELACRSSFKLLMMVHDELVFSSRNLVAATPGSEDYQFIEDGPHVQELLTIMQIMESAGTCIGIPCKVDAKVTISDWATRHSLEFNRT